MTTQGDKVLFDGSNSISFKSNLDCRQTSITSFKWEFHDGASANGPVAEKAKIVVQE